MPRHFSDYARFCVEMLNRCPDFNPCSVKPMMSGWAVSSYGANFAFICDLGGGEELWLKADKNSEGAFIAQGCSKFAYSSSYKGKRVIRFINYYSPPAECFESESEMRRWVLMALEAALAARK